jgi:two-component system, cell cycle response regulator DivK
LRESPLILVVEDNEANQLLACSVLEREGFRVVLAATAKEAMEQLSTQKPDLILMDVQLPGEDGLSLTRRLKADPRTSTIPIIALTAHAMVGDKEEALAAGCSGYIPKPINTRTLGEQVRQYIVPVAL